MKRGPKLSTILSPRQREVLALIYAGCTNREIAEALTIEYGTARKHVDDIKKRLGVRGKVGIVVAASRMDKP